MCFASALDWNKKGNSSTRERLLVNLFMTPVAATTRSMEPERSISNRCALLPEVERVWMFILIVPQEFLFTKSAIFCIPWWSTEFGCITIPACKVIFWFWYRENARSTMRSWSFSSGLSFVRDFIFVKRCKSVFLWSPRALAACDRFRFSLERARAVSMRAGELPRSWARFWKRLFQ